MSPNYRVCILTAGAGSRLNERTKYFNKALLRVGNKAVISHIVDAFPENTEFVIALGYKSDIVKQYLQITHPNSKFIYIDTKHYGQGYGPGYAVLQCKEELQDPFFFVSCDTIAERHDSLSFGDVIDKNWIGVSDIDFSDVDKYCTVISNEEGKVQAFIDKSSIGTQDAFIGLAFIKDYEDFWAAMDQNKNFIKDEIQISPALAALKDLKVVKCAWWDTGSEEGLKRAREVFSGIDNLDKLDEELYFKDEYVIKYFHNESMCQNRVVRSKHLYPTVPNIEQYSKNFYKYKFISGKDLFRKDNRQENMLPLLNYTQENLWNKKVTLSDIEHKMFLDTCRQFYYEKTKARLNKFYEQTNIVDEDVIINGVKLPSLKYLLSTIDWQNICNGIVSNTHGDWNMSNIIFDERSNKYTFVDWRQDFGGIVEYGDVYYDFAKMYACLYWPHTSIKSGKYVYEKNENNISVSIEIPNDLVESANLFDEWIIKNGYDLKKTKILTGIVWLNMAPLHEKPLDKHLYYSGVNMIYKSLNEKV
jgi:NDP-sugar pyrophosphorylase family protein